MRYKMPYVGILRLVHAWVRIVPAHIRSETIFDLPETHELDVLVHLTLHTARVCFAIIRTIARMCWICFYRQKSPNLFGGGWIAIPFNDANAMSHSNHKFIAFTRHRSYECGQRRIVWFSHNYRTASAIIVWTITQYWCVRFFQINVVHTTQLFCRPNKWRTIRSPFTTKTIWRITDYVDRPMIENYAFLVSVTYLNITPVSGL